MKVIHEGSGQELNVSNPAVITYTISRNMKRHWNLADSLFRMFFTTDCWLFP